MSSSSPALLSLFLLVACGVATPDAAEPSEATEESAGPREGEECMTPAQSRRGGDAPDPIPDPNAPPEPREHEGDVNGCASADVVFNNCCCNAMQGPRFDGTQCCYRFDVCGCC